MDVPAQEAEHAEASLLDVSEKEHCRSSTPSNMDSLIDFKGIEEEEFDFNLPLTDKSASNEEEEEEVFFGPQKFHEKVVAAAVKHLERELHPELVDSPSTLDFDQIAKDAQLMVDQLQEMKLNCSPYKSPKPKKTISYPIKKRVFSPSAKSIPTSNLCAARTSPKTPVTSHGGKAASPKVASPNVASTSKNKKGVHVPRKHRFALDLESIERSPVIQPPEKSLESLPKGEVEQTKDGVATFSAKPESKPEEKGKKPVPRRSLQQPGSKLKAPGKGIARSASLRMSKPSEVTTKKLPITKKPRCTDSSDEASETMSVCSDVSDSSVQSLHLPNGKRRLPAPKLKLVRPGLQKPSAGRAKEGSSKKPGPSPAEAAHRPAIKAPSRGASSVTTNMTKAAPMSKLSLIKPATKGVQNKLKTPVVTSTKKPGPMKATGPMKGVHPAPTTQKPTLEKPQPGTRRSIPSALPSQKSVAAVPPSKPSHLESTPVKPEKNVQPKKILNQLGTPRKNSDGGNSLDSATPQSVKRRSMLPTPTRSRLSSLNSSISSRRTGSSVSSEASAASINSPLRDTSNLLKPGPPVGLLIDLDPSSPGCFKSKKPGVFHTPQLRDNSVQRSIWSPIQRSKGCDIEDAFLCTKRTNVK